MRAYFVVPTALMTVAVASVEAFAFTKLTEQQVKNVCGKQLTEVGMSMGCTKKCGDKMCDYSCEKDANGKASNCGGFVVIKAPGGSFGKGPLTSGGILGTGLELGTRGPAAAGAPLGGGRAPSGPSLR